MYVHLNLNERAVLVRDGKPERALGPGHHHFWKRYEVDPLEHRRAHVHGAGRGARGPPARLVRERSRSRQVTTAS